MRDLPRVSRPKDPPMINLENNMSAEILQHSNVNAFLYAAANSTTQKAANSMQENENEGSLECYKIKNIFNQ